MGIFQNIPAPTPSQLADLLVYKTVWQYYPRKSFVSGLWLRDFYGTEIFLNCFARILDKDKFPYFRRYIKNLVLLTPGERALWMNGDEQARISYSQGLEERSGGKIKAEWVKMENLVVILEKEYKLYFPYTHKGIVGYKYTLDEQLKILSGLNKKFLEEIRN